MKTSLASILITCGIANGGRVYVGQKQCWTTCGWGGVRAKLDNFSCLLLQLKQCTEYAKAYEYLFPN